MLRYLFFGVVLAAAGTAAQAAGYDDYAKGQNAVNRGDNDEAIADFSQALQAGDLKPELVRVAYSARASAYLGKKMCDSALTDVNTVLSEAPGDSRALYLRMEADKCLKRFSQALADMDALIASNSGSLLYFRRGQMRWDAGNFAAADQDFVEMLKRAPTYAYPALWLAMTQQRLGNFDEHALANAAEDISLREWPGPILKFYLHKSTATDVYAEANSSGDAGTRTNQKCEADFYIGEAQLANGDPDGARQSLTAAAANCVHSFIEWDAAKQELARMPPASLH